MHIDRKWRHPQLTVELVAELRKLLVEVDQNSGEVEIAFLAVIDLDL